MSERASKTLSFAPILPSCPEILILGSLPSVASIGKNEYYGHPANMFWPIMATILGFDAKADYAERTRALRDARVALWDVLFACEREGSADAAIVGASEEANAIDELLVSQNTIRAVFFNGDKARLLFKKHIAPKLDDETQARVRTQRLPSTSPANASISREKKLACWSDALGAYL